MVVGARKTETVNAKELINISVLLNCTESTRFRSGFHFLPKNRRPNDLSTISSTENSLKTQ